MRYLPEVFSFNGNGGRRAEAPLSASKQRVLMSAKYGELAFGREKPCGEVRSGG
jgi:hypothetical protein